MPDDEDQLITDDESLDEAEEEYDKCESCDAYVQGNLCPCGYCDDCCFQECCDGCE